MTTFTCSVTFYHSLGCGWGTTFIEVGDLTSTVVVGLILIAVGGPTFLSRCCEAALSGWGAIWTEIGFGQSVLGVYRPLTKTCTVAGNNRSSIDGSGGVSGWSC